MSTRRFEDGRIVERGGGASVHAVHDHPMF